MNFNFKYRFLLAGLILAGCSPLRATQAVEPGGSLRGVATTSILGDVVRNVAGDHLDLQVLVPTGADEHAYQFSPEDVAAVTAADLIFINGAGLDEFMEPLLKNAGKIAPVIPVSDGIDLLQGAESAAGKQAGQPGAGDPHVWTDPANVMLWTDNIAAALVDLDPQHAAEYQANAAGYKEQLVELDRWIEQEVAQLPPAQRLLVTDHQVLSYFARRYGFRQVGAVIPAISTLAEPTARELAALLDAMREAGVKTVFVGNTVNPNLAQRLAEDLGVALAPLYTGSLSAGPPAQTYLDYMRYNVKTIVEALK